jgi:hypothetical protein
MRRPSPVSALAILAGSLTCLLCAQAYYIPGTYPREFKFGEELGGALHDRRRCVDRVGLAMPPRTSATPCCAAVTDTSVM